MRIAFPVIIASAAIGVLAGTAAPARATSANLTIDQWTAQRFDVRVNHLAAPRSMNVRSPISATCRSRSAWPIWSVSTIAITVSLNCALTRISPVASTPADSAFSAAGT